MGNRRGLWYPINDVSAAAPRLLFATVGVGAKRINLSGLGLCDIFSAAPGKFFICTSFTKYQKTNEFTTTETTIILTQCHPQNFVRH